MNMKKNDRQLFQKKGMPLRRRLFLVFSIMIIPFFILIFYLLYSINEISSSYDTIVKNITEINEYNLVFKEDIDSVMYMMVAHSLSKYEVKNELGMTNPDEMIRDAEEAFEKLRATTVSPSALEVLKGATRLLITLHKRVNDISSTVRETGSYDENMERLDMDIRVLTEMIQDRISQYIYFESQSMESIRQQMDENTVLLTRFSVMTTAALFILLFVLSSVFSRSITKPLTGLVESAEQIGRGYFDVKAKSEGSPEIQILADSFNSMAGQIGELVERNKQEQINLRNLELKLLQAQINPHFLYNTLDNIVWLAEDDRKEDVEGIAAALSTFFRTSLSGGRDVISIREEVLHIRSYLEIQQFRYRDILTYSIETEEGCGDYQILKMTLQPIVENALYHGIKNKRGGGSISINIGRTEDRLVIKIRDTGIGMTPDQLTELIRRVDGNLPPEKGNEGFGLSNVAERLRLSYGESAGMIFHSEYGKGTEVVVQIPVKYLT